MAGFFFTFLWAMVKKMWAICIGLLSGSVVVAMIFTLADAGAVGDAVTNVMSLASSALLDSVIAANADNANALFLKAAPTGI